MTASTRKTFMTESLQQRCDTRVWSGECRKSDYATGGNEYLCVACGTIHALDHEVHHEVFPHVSGDEDNLA
jgi:hypothetical protein